MKIKLTEQQIGGLVKNFKNNISSTQSDDIDLERDAPNLSKLVKFITGSNADNTDNTNKNLNTNKPISGSQFAKNIPSGSQMMHPLGHKEPITSPFGSRNPGIRGASTNHKGVDIATPSNSPVYAPLDGVVMDSRDTTPNACGGFIQLNHINVETKFCHLSRMVVQQGEKVKKGQIIGYSGGGRNDPHPGIASGPHLHYEILDKRGVAEDPLMVEPNLA